MTEDDNTEDPTKDLTEGLTDRQLLLQLRQAMSALLERMTELENRTNPLPPNYDARFTALEESVREIRAEQRRFSHKLDKLALDLLETHAQQRETADRVTILESRPS